MSYVAHARHPLSLGRIAFLFAVFLGISNVGSAFAEEAVTVKLTAAKVEVGKNGKETFAAADEAKPGEVIRYEAVYRNTTAQAVTGLQANVPIPPGLELLLESASPAGALASLDGKTFAAMPLMTKPAGEEKSVPVPASQYRALRWTIPTLEGGAATTVTLRARVLTNQPPGKPKP